jgi:peptidoglycan/xylan/chitin deacetylase (PgdA/CDA1 family)/2-polyprenyl-3-methyl-5-hydroxy-6-metoxy-1,4-benzoquinol methylase
MCRIGMRLWNCESPLGLADVTISILRLKLANSPVPSREGAVDAPRYLAPLGESGDANFELEENHEPYKRWAQEDYWNAFFQTPEPIAYGSSYEQTKYLQALSLVPDGVCRALEVACAEGHFTTMLADRVSTLLATDISGIALERAAARCVNRPSVKFQKLNLVNSPISETFDLIVCGEVLYYFSLDRMEQVAQKLADALANGGCMLLTHANLLSDDPHHTGFDWEGHTFGAKSIGEVFSAISYLHLERELRTPLYRIHLFRKIEQGFASLQRAEITEIPLEASLTPAVEKTIIWGGAVVRQRDANFLETASQIPILMYHRIAEDGPQELAQWRTSPQLFRQHLTWLRRHGYRSIAIDEWVTALREQRPLAGRPVLITFDDGYDDFASSAWPILERHGFTATVFIVTDLVGGTADWDRSFGNPARLMDWHDIQKLSRQGVDFGSHTTTHQLLPEISFDEVLSAAINSRTTLESKIGKEVVSIAYPWGGHDEAIQAAFATCGYKVGLTTKPGFSFLSDSIMALPRVEICGSDGLEDFSKKLRWLGLEP